MESLSAFCLMVALHSASLEPTVDKLGSDSFREREKAQRVLERQMSVPYGEFLARSVRAKARSDLETELRLKKLCFHWENFATDYGTTPWISSLPKDYPDREKTVQCYLKKASDEMGFDWDIPDSGFVRWRVATYLLLSDLRKRGWYNSALRQLQKEMEELDRSWVANKKYPF